MVSVVLKVCLATHIDAIVVTQRIHCHIVRIVRRAQCVDIVLLKQQHILQHTLCRHRTASHRVGVVAVHAFEKHSLVVHIHQRAFYLYLAYAMFGGEGHHFVALAVCLHHINCI